MSFCLLNHSLFAVFLIYSEKLASLGIQFLLSGSETLSVVLLLFAFFSQWMHRYNLYKTFPLCYKELSCVRVCARVWFKGVELVVAEN